jgi:precorrin-6A/cobalt-precorrin-6A reductase
MVSHRGATLELGFWALAMAFKILILGGTSEGRKLAEELVARTNHDVLLSFAGRTESLVRPGVPHRIGGFGGSAGLADFLRTQGFHVLVDATHAFAAQISANAVQASERAEIPLLRLSCPAWQRQPGDQWTEVLGMHEAAKALGRLPARVFLSVGRLEVSAFAVAPQHDYLIRAVDAFDPGLPRARVLCARGPFALADERALLERERIDVLVSKNAGTDATHAKLIAARELGVSVVMVARPWLPEAETVATVPEACAWLERVHASSSLRGV